MSTLTELDKVLGMLYDINDTVRSNCGDEAYYALRDAIESVRNAWNVCKRGQEAKLENAYKDPVQSSRKPIKSGYDNEIYRQAFGALLEDYAPEGNYPGGYRVLVDGNYETEFSANSREEAIQKFKDYFANKKKGVNSSRQIKSSLEDRLVPYLEEFEEGYADALTSTDEMGNNARLETFYEMFKSDYNLSDDDINKLEGAVQDIWHETEEEYDGEHDMGEMYGVPYGASPEEALKVFESRKPIKSSSMSGWFSGICDKCKQFTNVRYVGYKGRKLCAKCSRGR